MGIAARSLLLLSYLLRVAIGVLIAGLGGLLAFGMAGAGHGWVTPLFFSFALFLAYPVVLLRISATGRRWVIFDAIIVTLGAVSDLGLLLATIEEGTSYFWLVVEIQGLVPLTWLLIWFGWQIVALISLSRDRTPEEGWGYYR